MKNIYILPLILFITFSNVVFGGEYTDGEGVWLWGKYYNISSTYSFINTNNQLLTGEIPPE